MSDDDFMGGGGKSVPFEQIGDSVTGVVISLPKKQEQTDDEGNVRTFPNGQPRYVYLVQIQTELRDPEDPADDGVRTLWLKWKSHEAVIAAIRRSGAKNLELNGVLCLTLSGFGQKAKASHNPPKLYTAEYLPPTSSPGFMDDAPVSSVPQSPPPARVPTPTNTGTSLAATVAAQQGNLLQRMQEQAAARRAAGTLPPPPHHGTEENPPF